MKIKNNISFIFEKKKNIYLLWLIQIILLLLTIGNAQLYKLFAESIIGNSNVISTNVILKFLTIVIGIVLIYIFEYFIKLKNKDISDKIFFNHKIKIRTYIINNYLKNKCECDIGEMNNLVCDDIDNYILYLSTSYINLPFEITKLIFYSIFICVTNIYLATLGLIVFTITVLVNTFVNRVIKKSSMELRNAKAKNDNFLMYNLTNWKEIKTNQLLQYILDDSQNIFVNLFNYSKTYQLYTYFRKLVVSFNNFIVIRLLSYFIGGLLVLKGYCNIQSLLLFLVFYEMFLSQINCVSNKVSEYLSYKPSAVKIKKQLECCNLNTKNKDLKKDISNLKVKNLTYKYDNQKNLLFENLNYEFKSNEISVIYGKSGSGKSTFLKLILGLIKPIYGNIYYDEIDITEYNYGEISTVVSMVTQEPYLFNMTLYENLLLGNSHITKKQVQEICNKYSLFNFINKLNDGLDTYISNRGTNISIGQKQRISILRAILMDCPILILDEPSAALDDENEENLISLIKDISKKKIVIISTHSEKLFSIANKCLNIGEYDE